MRRGAHVRAGAASALLGVALVVAGCGTTDPPDLAQESAEELRSAVHAVATAAAQERYDAASAALEDVRAALDEAVESDSVTVQRYREIDQAIQRTGELLASRAEAGAPAEAEAEAEDPGAADPAEHETEGSSGPDDTPASVTTAPAPAPAPAVTPSEGSSRPRGAGPPGVGPGSSGKGNGSPPGVPARGRGQGNG